MRTIARGLAPAALLALGLGATAGAGGFPWSNLPVIVPPTTDLPSAGPVDDLVVGDGDLPVIIPPMVDPPPAQPVLDVKIDLDGFIGARLDPWTGELRAVLVAGGDTYQVAGLDILPLGQPINVRGRVCGLCFSPYADFVVVEATVTQLVLASR